MTHADDAIRRDIAAVGRIGAVPLLLRIICKNTGMGFAAVARVTESAWVACAVRDEIEFGLRAGGELPLESTLCFESRRDVRPIAIDRASDDPQYRDHHTMRIYNIESYISVPIVLASGEYFGNLCAIDPGPASVSDDRTLSMFTHFAELIALQLDSESRQSAMETALIDERATAELREQFIAVLGHDLRNPLAAVSATAQLLERRSTQPDLVSMGRRLQAVSRRMSHLIDDVMDFARGRLGAGIGGTLSLVDDLEVALRDVIAELRDANASRTVVEQVTVEVPVFCDRGRIQQLLSNLISNAIQHGASEFPVRVQVWVEASELRLSVCNHGEPIPADHLDKVFEPFWRPEGDDRGGGLGLGLYICSEIVKAHHGRLEVSSSTSLGTCFTASLPVAGR
jgi:signal transduction histidine kinase